jgi:hypothetical protein
MPDTTPEGPPKLNKVRLKEVFKGLQDEMVAKLNTARLNIPHPGTMGDVGEASWLQIFQEYLPKRYQAESATVIDCHGNCSQQIDIVIFDRQYSPFLLKLDDAKFVPAESVYAVFEVKQEMKGNIDYAGKKAASVRILHRTSATLVDRGAVCAPREHFRILAGLLCLDSGWTTPFGKPFKAGIEALTELQQLDCGCCLKGGSFEYAREKGDANLVTSSDETSLIHFFLRLLAQLQALGTVPAIDVNCYAKQLE